MADDDVTRQIEDARREVAAQKEALDELAKKYIETAKISLPPYFREWMDREVKRQPDLVQRMGAEGARKVKSELQAFNDNLPQLVDQAFPKPEDWWHHRKLPADTFSQNNPMSLHGKNEIEERLRTLLSPFGAILVRHGFAKVAYDKTEWGGSPERPTYRYNPGIPPAIGSAHGDYARAFEILINKNRRLLQLEEAKSQHDAKKLWDEA